jgi:hypothetical protein
MSARDIVLVFGAPHDEECIKMTLDRADQDILHEETSTIETDRSKSSATQ